MTKSLSCMAFLVLCLAGCRDTWEADYSKLGLVNVSGTVTLDGKPLANATIIFECPDKTYSFGETDADGNYKLMFDTSKAGALPGPKVVRIRTGPVGEEGAEVEGADGRVAKAAADSVPACYGAKSKLTATVEEGSSQTFNFDLKSDCSVTGPTS